MNSAAQTTDLTINVNLYFLDLASLTVTAVAVMGVFSVYTYLAWFASETAHLEGVSITVIYFVFGVCAVASNLLSGWLIDRHPPRRIVGKSRDLPIARAAMTAGNGGRKTLG